MNNQTKFKADPYNFSNKLISKQQVIDILHKVDINDFKPKDISLYQTAFIHKSYNPLEDYKEFKKPDNCLLTYNPETKRLYVHVLEWPFKTIYLPGLADKVAYAQILNDGSELKLKTKKGAWLDDVKSDDNGLTITIPVTKPDVEIPVIELFLK